MKIQIEETTPYCAVVTIRMPIAVRNELNAIAKFRRETNGKMSMEKICLAAILREFDLEIEKVQLEENK